MYVLKMSFWQVYTIIIEFKESYYVEQKINSDKIQNSVNQAFDTINVKSLDENCVPKKTYYSSLPISK